MKLYKDTSRAKKKPTITTFINNIKYRESIQQMNKSIKFLESVPKELLELPRWALWKLHSERGKLPVKINEAKTNLEGVSVTKERDWITFVELEKEVYHLQEEKPHFFNEVEPSFSLRLPTLAEIKQQVNPQLWFFLDVDNFSYGESSDFVKTLVANLEAKRLYGFQETSQSGNGLHFVFKVNTKDADTSNLRLITGLFKRFSEHKLELYTHSRFIATTGNFVGNTGDYIMDFKELEELFRPVELRIPFSAVSSATLPLSGYALEVNKEQEVPEFFEPCPLQSNDHALVSKILNSKQGLKFKALHVNGDISYYENDHSRAVFAWQSIVSFWTQDGVQMARLFVNSALFYGKWAKGKAERLLGDQFGRILSKRDTKNMYKGGGKKPTKKPIREEKVVEQVVISNSETTTEYGALTCPYEALLVSTFGTVRRDLMSGNLCVRNPSKEGHWIELLDDQVIEALRSKIHELNEAGGNRGDALKPSHVKSYLHKICLFSFKEIEPTLGIEIPVWDGLDRIKDMASCLNVKDVALKPKYVEYFLKDWLVRAVARVHNPSIQNRVILFQGGQGIGKDQFFKTLCGGFGKYFCSPQIPSQYQATEKYFAEIVYNKAVALFDEFDRLQGLDSMFKALVTKEYFDMRLPYARSADTYPHRCSYVASCNVSSMLSDSTGNRRFLVIQLEGQKGIAIKWLYGATERDSEQVLAQAYYMYNLNGRKPLKPFDEAEEVMERIQVTHTPDSPDEEILEMFRMLLEDMIQETKNYDADSPIEFYFYSLDECLNSLNKIRNTLEMPMKSVRTILKNNGFYKKVQHRVDGKMIGRRVYGFPEHLINEWMTKAFLHKIYNLKEAEEKLGNEIN